MAALSKSQTAIPANHPEINAAFIRELQKFKRGGYQFNDSGKALFEGTQREAFDAYLNGIKHGHHEGYFEIPTGVGKTALFIAIIGCYLRATEKMPDAPRVLIHEPTLDLVTQTALAFADFMPDIAKELEAEDEQGREIDWENSAVEVHYGKRKGAKNDHRVLITTYQSQASDERKVNTADSFEVQVRKLCIFVSSQLNGEQKQEACDAINAALSDASGKFVTPDSVRKAAKPLTKAIEKAFSDVPDLHDFLGAVQSKIPNNNPLKTYRTQLEADKALAAQKRTFKAEDFHLVIHDEAHYLTGEKYGPAAVDKFQGALQLGVTATPEYSKTKTVANKLAHRYYELPLNTAIKRGDLCHVRPLVLKTNIVVDKEKARKFLQERAGRPLSNKQLEQLLNQTARNQAVIQAYLSSSHPDTGERFLGQTGMIFAGGITHCGDFIRDAYKLLDKPAYREIKNWLRDEGLALIAPIHSDVPDEGMDIILGGKKQKCTKDQIKDLHRAGKILLLISDQELKLGTDFPMDSFIAELVDRFSVPDATQRVGRGFRVDRGTPRYNLPPNPNKSCAVLNVIDENTHEIYAGTHHHPIHAIEILHGAEHRPPGRKKGALTRFTKQPPEIDKAMEAAGFELITRVDEIRDLADKFKKETKSKNENLPEKNKHWLSSTDTQDAELVPGGKRTGLRKAVRDLTGNSSPYDSNKLGVQTVNYKGQAIDLQKMQSGPNQPICIRRIHWGRVEKAAGVGQGVALPDKDENWLSSVDTENSKIVPGGTRIPLRAAVRDLTGDFSPYDSKKLGIQTIKYKGQLIDLQKMQSGPHQSICIRRTHWGRVEKAAGVEKGITLLNKDEHWISLKDTKDSKIVPGGNRGPVQEAAKNLAGNSSPYDSNKLGVQTVNYKGQAIDLQKMQSGPNQPICIRRIHWGRVEKAAGVEPMYSNESLKSKPIQPRTITPGSDALKRTGRTRGEG